MSLLPLSWRLWLTLGVVAVPGIAAAQEWQPRQKDWVRYVVPGSGASVDLPTALFSDDSGDVESGRGRRFVTADGRATIVIQSVPNPEGDTPAAFLAKKQPPSGILYRRITPRFFVVSSYRGDKIWYNRCNRAALYMNCVLINYPANEKRQWDAVVTRISRTLSSGR